MLNKSKLLTIAMFVANNALAFDNSGEQRVTSPVSTRPSFSSASSAFSSVSAHVSQSPLLEAHRSVLDCVSPVVSISPTDESRTILSRASLPRSWADMADEEHAIERATKTYASVVATKFIPKTFTFKK